MGGTSLLVDSDRLKAIADRLRLRYRAQRVILFGSMARGEATEDSDIDLLVISATPEKFHRRVGSVLEVVREISLGMPLAPIVLTPEEVEARLARGDQFIQEILSMGAEL